MDYNIGDAFDRIENELIESMMRNFKRHRAEETKEGFEWIAWQVKQLESLERFKKATAKKYGREFGSINRSIDAVIAEAYKQGKSEAEIAILEAIKEGFKGYEKLNPVLSGEFFNLNERKLEALINATKGEIYKAEQSILRKADDEYRQIIFNAQTYANTGAGTYEKAVDMASKDFLRNGLTCVRYANGSLHSLAEYAAMAIRTANTRAYLYGEGVKRAEWGVHTIIINKRATSGKLAVCPLCLPWVGKVLIDDVYSGGTAEESERTGYPLLSYAMQQGLFHPNCKDIATTYFEGLTTPDKVFKKSEIKEITNDYKQETRTGIIKNNIARFGRLANNSLDAENIKHYKAKQKEWEEALNANKSS